MKIRRLIIDTDLGADCDDCVALALALNLYKQGKIEIEGITISSTREYAPNTLQSIFDYFGTSFDIGQMSSPAIDADQMDHYCFEFKNHKVKNKIHDAVKLMRQKLANAKEKLTIVTLGPLANISRLIDSQSDEISPLSGLELINSKVESMCIMGCRFDSKEAEWNIKSDINSAINVFNNVNVPLYILPSECGGKIKTGDVTESELDSPIRLAIDTFQKANNQSHDFNRESWDPVTVLFASGYDEFDVSQGKRITIDDKGVSLFAKDEGNHYIVCGKDESKIRDYINSNIINKNNKTEGIHMENKNLLAKKEIELQKRNKAKVKSILFPSDVDENDKDNNYIVLKNINKIYDNDVQAVFDFNLNIKKNEFIVLVGPSGCGKSTTLRMIAGLEEISSGDLFINSVYSNDLAPKNRDIAMVFQSYALYPHMTVYNNLAFGLRIRKFATKVLDENGKEVMWIDKNNIKKIESQLKDCETIKKLCNKEVEKLAAIQGDEDEMFVASKRIEYYNKQIELANAKEQELVAEKEKAEKTEVPKYVLKHLPSEEIDRRVKEAARILEIDGYLSRKPKALSGGQRQRVALGRAIVRNAAAFLMDEPLSNLDAKLRVQMRSEIVNIHRAVDATTIYVTHDQTEAMTMADRIVVMKDGMVQQVGTPIEVYSNPRNLFVAQFIGAPAMNVIKAKYDNGNIVFEDGNKLELKDSINRVKDYYESEINRLSGIVETMSDLIRDKKHKRYNIFEAAKNEATELIEKYTDRRDGLSFDVLFGIRPEDVCVVEKKTPSSYEVKADVVELLGSEYYIHVNFDGQKFVAKTPNERLIKTGDTVYIEFKNQKIHLFDKDSEMAIF